MFDKERESWNNIKTVRDFLQWTKREDLDVLGWCMHNRDLSKGGFWIGAHVKFNFDLDDYAIGPLTMPDSTNRFLLIMCCFCTSALAPPK